MDDLSLFVGPRNGLRQIIPRIKSEKPQDDWGLIVKNGESIGIFITDSQVENACRLVGCEFVQGLSVKQRHSIVWFAEMIKIAQLVEREANCRMWSDLECLNNEHSQVRHYDGLQVQVERVVDFGAGDIAELSPFIESLHSQAPDDVELRTVADWLLMPYLSDFVSQDNFPSLNYQSVSSLSPGEWLTDVYILPLKYGDKDGIVERCVDYGSASASDYPKDTWHSDNSDYLFCVLACNLDRRLRIYYHSKVELLYPEFAMKIINVKVPRQDGG